MKQTFRSAFRLIAWDWSTLFLFELLYKLLSAIVVFPFFRAMLQYALQLSGVSLLSHQTLCLVLQSPATLLSLLLLLVLFSFYIFIEIVGIVLYFDNGIQGKRVGVFPLLVSAAKKACSIIHPKKFSLLVFVLLILPMAGVTLSAGPLQSLEIPGFILGFIASKPGLYVLYGVSRFLILILAFRWIFSIHEVTLQRCSFREARARSRFLMRRKWFRMLTWFCVWFLYMIGLLVVFTAVALCTVLLIIKYTVPPNYAQETFWYYLPTLSKWCAFLWSICVSIGSFALVSSFYYAYQSDDAAFAFQKSSFPRKKRGAILRPLRLFLALFFLGIYGFHLLSFDEFLLEKEINLTTSIVAHRSATLTTPENTLSGLEAAIESGAAYAEIDVQQAKDGTLVLMHDANLQRTAGVNQNIWDLTYRQLQELDVGSWFSPAFSGEKIPTLAEFIQKAKGKIVLVIELKSTGHEKGFTSSVVQLIQQFGAEKDCIIASMDYTLIKEAKSCSPAIQTQLITTMAYGDLYHLEDVDSYSVEASCLTRSMVRNLHLSNKKIFVWTVNNSSLAREMVAMRVDSIITDAPDIISTVISKQSSCPLISSAVHWILPATKVSSLSGGIWERSLQL